MDLFASEAGLKLLLAPLGSNIVVRTACCSVGVVLPVYSTFKAIETKNQKEKERWLMYWAAFGSFTVAEVFTDTLISWIPLYYHMKFAFLVWLQIPSTEGAKHIYEKHLQPFFRRHQGRLDQVAGFAYSELAKFVSLHKRELQFVKTLLLKILVAGKDIIQPSEPRQIARTIEGATQQVQEETNDDINSPSVEQNTESDDKE
ncbi:HVA22-like protein k [Impatiens glandulifera]|uniref:HVA22-like protein k n=1 Tax=Impatiens glandulifera TaxID=253017 RepID=UPI001FB0D955|nr:HVA22-like protein k [Impatiens glandulifera]